MIESVEHLEATFDFEPLLNREATTHGNVDRPGSGIAQKVARHVSECARLSRLPEIREYLFCNVKHRLRAIELGLIL